MYIEPVQCPKCGHAGRPGEQGMNTDGQRVTCQCGNIITLDKYADQAILSSNIFVRLTEASNHNQYGSVQLTPGYATRVTFEEPFDFPAVAFLTPVGASMHHAVQRLKPDGMMIVTSTNRDFKKAPSQLKPGINWAVYGLTDVDSLPNWYVLFYGAITQLEKGLYKSALFDYATAFEVFIESFLSARLAKSFGGDVSEFMLGRTWKISTRVKDLLELVIGKRLTERNDIYQAWDQDVRQPRNHIAHGQTRSVEKMDAEKAHQAVYQAIRWIQSGSGDEWRRVWS